MYLTFYVKLCLLELAIYALLLNHTSRNTNCYNYLERSFSTTHKSNTIHKIRHNIQNATVPNNDENKKRNLM